MGVHCCVSSVEYSHLHSSMGRCLNICKIVSACTGLVFIVLGASLKWGIFPAVVNSMIISTLQLKPENKETWEAWVRQFSFFTVLIVNILERAPCHTIHEVYI